MRDVGALRFEWLLRQRDFEFVGEQRLEERIEIRDGKRPDFFVWRDGTEFLVEVESFRAPGPLAGLRGVRTVSSKRLIKPIGNAIQHARTQLRPYTELRIPLVIVLDDHRRVGIDLSASVLLHLFGELRFVVPIGAGRDHEWSMEHGRDGVFRTGHGGDRGHKRYISAIAVLTPNPASAHIEPVDRERPMRLKVMHNPDALVPLPRSLFSATEDYHAFQTDGVWQIPRNW